MIRPTYHNNYHIISYGIILYYSIKYKITNNTTKNLITKTANCKLQTVYYYCLFFL